MAEGDVTIPKVGTLPKKVVIPLAIGIVGFVGWRFWVARQGTGDDASPIEDGEFGAVDSSIPGVIGGVSPTNEYGRDTGSDPGNDPTRFTTNAQWTEYVVGKLQQSETWTYNEIMTAIGSGLASKPTTDEQQKILRAALAIGGQPPGGAIVIISGGNTAPISAPTGLTAVTIRPNHITFRWNPVDGATTYRVTRSGGGGTYTATGPQVTVDGLTAATSYTFTVAAVNASGSTAGPSASFTAKTSATAPNSNPRGYGWYKARKGDNIKTVTKKYSITNEQFIAWNGGDALRVGEWVKVRASSNPTVGYNGVK